MELLERLYDLPWTLPDSELHDRVRREYALYGRCLEPLRAALGCAPQHLFGFLTDTVQVGEPVWAELRPPHTLWVDDGGWRALDQLGEPVPSEFLAKALRARWLILVLASPSDLEGAHEMWLTELGGFGPETVDLLWASAPRDGVADALFCLWAAFFFEAPPLIDKLLFETEGHASPLVQATRQVLRSSAYDWLWRHVHMQRTSFLRLVRGELPERAPEPGPAVLAARLGEVPARIAPQLAVFASELGDLGLGLHADSGLTVDEALAVMEAPGEPVVEISLDTAPGLARLVESPSFARVRRLELEGLTLGALPLSPHAAGLCEIAAESAQPEDLRRLASLGARVHSLKFERPSPLGPEGFRLLAEHPSFEQLGMLVCPSPCCGDEAAAAWAGSGRPRHLRTLVLGNEDAQAKAQGLGPVGARALLSCPLPGLRTLVLSDHALGDEAVLAWTANPEVGALHHLRLPGCGLTAASLEALASCGWLRGLDWLDLSRDEVGPDAVRALVRALDGVRLLSLSGVQDEGARVLAEANLPRLGNLALSASHLTCDGVAALARAPWLAGLHAFDLRDNYMGEEGAVALARSELAQGLAFLWLDGNPLGPEGVRTLLALPGLKTLRASGCGVSEQARAELQALRPEVRLLV